MLQPNGVMHGLKANNKKQLLQLISQKFSELTNLSESDVVESLTERERLGSTGMGRGVAIPHARMAGIDRVYTVLITLSQPMEFDAIDDHPVDVLCALLAPEDAGADHLQALARVSRLLRDKAFCNKLRGANSQDAMEALLVGYDDNSAMAA